MNNVILTGRIAKDLELRYTQTGKAYCRLTLAVDRGMSKEKKQEAEAKGQPTADFISCVVWNKLAETINRFSGKGRKILVEGSIQTGSFTAEDGLKKYTTDILVNRAEILEFANNNTTEDTQPFGQFDLPYEEANNEDIPF
uniref:Single-stranded DNA-binding protein n=1 Tax=Siphoviridae sp. ctnR613 TaxID=2827939 RepID=A0A8S5SNX1_9CAUD|nr:MAG TPA: Single strand binding protein [Siphoviridae sp. ctnR613]